MASREDIEAAVKAGVLSEEAANSLTNFLGEKLPSVSGSSQTLSARQLGGEEPLRFIRNFHDVFLAMGLQILSAGVFVFAGILLGGQIQKLVGEVENLEGFQLMSTLAVEAPAILWFGVLLSAATAGVLWLLAEYFAGRKRLFFPAIIICLNFSFAVFIGAFALYTALFFRDAGVITYGLSTGDPVLKVRMIPVYLVASALAPIVAYYIRFKLPFAMGLIGIGASALVVTAVAVFNWPLIVDNSGPIVLTIGILMFVFGMLFDIRDPERVTRFSDNGFWLHMIAAVPILLGLKATLYGWKNPFDIAPSEAPVLLIVIAIFGVISLLINRRALVVSGMLTAGIAFGVILSQSGMGMSGNVAATLLGLGVVMVLLGASWHWLRAIILKPIPKTGLIARIFPPEIGADG